MDPDLETSIGIRFHFTQLLSSSSWRRAQIAAFSLRLALSLSTHAVELK
jgi:hypothetical protein